MAVMFLALSVPVSSLSIDVNVEKNFSGDLKITENSNNNGVRKMTIEFFNSGSLPYVAMARMDLLENGKTVCTSWSNRRSLNPGERDYFGLFCRVDHSGKFIPRLRIYYSNEIMEKYYPEEEIIVSESSNIFVINNAASGNNYIVFDLMSPESKDVVIATESYLPGWIFHQVKTNLVANVSSKQKINYDADVLMNNDVVVSVYSVDGSSFSIQRIEVGTGEGSLGKFIDQILGFFSSVLKT